MKNRLFGPKARPCGPTTETGSGARKLLMTLPSDGSSSQMFVSVPVVRTEYSRPAEGGVTGDVWIQFGRDTWETA